MSSVLTRRAPVYRSRHSESGRVAVRLIGALLLALSMFPVYRLLASPETGLAGSVTVSLLDVYSDFMWAGLLLMLPVALMCGLFMTPAMLDRASAALCMPARLRTWHYAALLGLLSFGVTLLFTLTVLDGWPNHIDSLAQMLHARFWAEGRLAGPSGADGGFRALQNSLFTGRGWVSQYPPGHVALLAVALWLGAPAALGACLVGLTVFVATLLVRRLFPDDDMLAVLAPALLAVSPFFVLLGGSFMNHVTAAAGVTLGAYALLRAWQDRAAWAFAAGAAFAWSFATRPWSTLTMVAALVLTIPFLTPERVTRHRFVAVHSRALLGAAPVMAAFLAYNTHFFGGPLTMGYNLALGPGMRLGFHRDPWGNMYGLREALGYTSSDLITLSVNLLETPIPTVAVVGMFLLLLPRLGPAVRVLLAWALLPVVSNMLYWHHGQFMGPRMLHEAAPAWVLLFSAAAIGLIRRAPRNPIGRFNLRTAAAGALAAAVLLGPGYLAPQRATSYGGEWLAVTRAAVPQPNRPALVFVHGAWTGRVAMTLAAAGYRLDQIETLLRQNTTCTVHRLAALKAAGAHDAAGALYSRLDTVPRPDRLPESIEIAPGDMMRLRDGDTLTPECIREIESDRFGIIDVAPFLWQGDLPGGPARGALFVRDMGPERNAVLIARNPGRIPWLFMLTDPNGEPQLMPYDEGIRLLWGEA
jgi:hypothetical protein